MTTFQAYLRIQVSESLLEWKKGVLNNPKMFWNTRNSSAEILIPLPKVEQQNRIRLDKREALLLWYTYYYYGYEIFFKLHC